jgi:hypothetical protein
MKSISRLSFSRNCQMETGISLTVASFQPGNQLGHRNPSICRLIHQKSAD